jgi:hypothetical protein
MPDRATLVRTRRSTPACPDPLVDRHPAVVASRVQETRRCSGAHGSVVTGTLTLGRLAAPVATWRALGSGRGRVGGGVVVDGADERLDGGVERLGATGGAAEDQRALER